MSTRELQELLKAKGFDPGAIDGIMGPNTRAAIRAFQKANGLTVDGIVGSDTTLALQDTQKKDVDDSTIGADGEVVTVADVQRVFDDLNIPVGTSRESAGVRLARIVEEINSGSRTLADVISALGGFRSDTVTPDVVKAVFSDLGITTIGTPTESETVRLQRITDEINAGDRTLADVRLALAPFAKEVAPGDRPLVPGEDPDPAPPPVGAEEGLASGVLGGGELVQVRRKDQTDLFFMRYEFPPGSGQWIMYQFESRDEVTQSLGKDAFTSGVVPFRELPESVLNDPAFTVAGSAEGNVVGQSGTFQELSADITSEVARKAGVSDPTLLARYLSDPEIQAILSRKVLAGDKMTDAEVTAAVRQTNFFQNVLYPGITTLFGRTSQPEVLWKQYANNVEGSLVELGVQRDADGSFRSTLGTMLGSGIEDKSFNEFSSVFVRAANSEEYAGVLNQWTERDLGRTIDFDDVFDVLGGTSDAELQQIVERAGLQFQAERAGVEIDRRLIMSLARTTDLSEAQVAANFSTSEQRLLSLGDVGLKRSGLTQDALIQGAFGNVAIVDGVEMSPAELSARASKFAVELGLEDNPKAQLFVGFTQEGQPTRPGLESLAPEGA